MRDVMIVHAYSSSYIVFFFFSSRRRHTRLQGDWSSDVCSSDLALGSPRGRLKNFVCEGHVDLRPRGPLLFGIEFRRLETTYPSGKFTANHFNLAAGYRF